MAGAAQEEIERLRIEQGQQFLKQMADMFTATRADLAQQYVPRTEMRSELDHTNEAVRRVAEAVEKLTGNVSNFHENAPRIYADKAETKQDIAALSTEIEKLKTARESDMQRGYDYRFDDMRGRYRGDVAVERGWRVNAAQQGNQMLGWVIGGSLALLTIAVNVILALALRH